MQKIISLFQRNYETDRLVRNEVVPGAEWVINGEGIATRKFDGTCCLIKEGVFYKRYDVKKKRKKPEGFIPAQDPDPVTGHWPGWVIVGGGPEDKWHREAFREDLADGTYELCGPKVKTNHEGFLKHVLLLHGEVEVPGCPRDYVGLKRFFSDIDIEGIVWHHPDGRMVKLKVRDFGFERKRILQVWFEGIDDFSRPVFRSEGGARYGSTDILFPAGADEEEVLENVIESDLVWFGDRFNCEPMGGAPVLPLKIQKKGGSRER